MPELEGPSWDIGLAGMGRAAFDSGDGQEMNGPFTMLPKK
jgi:hypothetical protein